MSGGNFLHRAMTYLVNELLVNGLANSPTFQRFAVQTSKKIEAASEVAAKTKQQLAEEFKQITKNFDSSGKR